MSERLTLAMRRSAQIIRAEQSVEAAAYTALLALVKQARTQLAHSHMSVDSLDTRNPAWQRQIDLHLVPAIAAVVRSAYRGGLVAAAQPSEVLTPADVAADRYLTAGARNRLVGVADTVYGAITDTIREGMSTGGGESIPELTARVDGLLSDSQRWRNRARVIARTETLAAHSYGAQIAAEDNTRTLGHSPADVAKEWLATSDDRTRPSHADADGQIVQGMHTPFQVGGSELQRPGDLNGDAEEVINCRCTVLYHYPDDPVTASARPYRPNPRSRHTVTATQEEQMTTTPAEAPAGPAPDEADENARTVVVVALPAADDPCQVIGEEQKHATLLYFGGIPGSGDDTENPGLTPDFLDALTTLVADTAGATPAFSTPVTGVESLGPDGARVWMLGGDDMAKLRDALTVGPIPDVLGQVTQYPTYTPHVTIGYPPDAPADAEEETDDDLPDADDAAPDAPPPDTTPLDDATEQAAAGIQSISFDRLACWIGTEQTEYPLAPGGSQAPAPAPDAPPTAAAVQAALALLKRAVSSAQAAANPRTFAVPPPGEAPAGGPTRAQDIPADGEPFYGIACPEDVMSGDGRVFAVGAITWRDLPLPLMYQDATLPGHDGAVRVGRLDALTRDDTTYAKPMIRYAGVWDTSDLAVEAQRQVGAQIVRGVSVDCDAVTVELQDSAGQPLDPMVDDFPADGVVIECASEARISGLTICSIPAFPQAYIANGTYDSTVAEPGMDELDTPASPPADGEPAVAASAWALVASSSAIPVWPYADFSDPCLDEPTRLTVTDDGRVYGHLATWGVCHIGIEGVCQEAPVSATDYAYFAKGYVDTDKGLVATGPLTMGTGHAAMTYGARAAAAHYDNTGTVVADVAIGQDSIGIWVAGRMRPGTTPEDLYALRAAGALSGDWREIGTGLELVAALVVNTPGFPIPAPAVAASAAGATALVASGVVKPKPARASGNDVVREVIASLDRRERVRVASARLRAQRAATARRRLTAARKRRVLSIAARMNRGGH